jgi:hypothetical protein
MCVVKKKWMFEHLLGLIVVAANICDIEHIYTLYFILRGVYLRVQRAFFVRN